MMSIPFFCSHHAESYQEQGDDEMNSHSGADGC